ncbi:MAG: phage/plasmid primase, P4 family [Bryobacteraceae bacterium]
MQNYALNTSKGESAASPVPLSLRKRRQWVLWCCERRNGDKPTKVPYSTAGCRASSQDPKTWATFQEVDSLKSKYDGVGFVFTATDPFVGIDLDGCLDDDGALKPWARGVVKDFDGTYMETSPSGRGVHIICEGQLPGGRGRQIVLNDGHVELYDRGRYFTVTGVSFNGSPSKIINCQAAVDKLLARESKTVGKATVGVVTPGLRHNDLVSVGATLRAHGLNGAELFTALAARNFQACQPPLEPAEVRAIVDWCATQPPVFEMNEVGNGLRFALLHGGTSRWCSDLNAWFHFDGKRWVRDNLCITDRKAFEVTRAMATEAAATTDADLAKRLLAWTNASKSNRAQKAIVDQAKKWLPVTPAEFDRDANLLNVQNGTLDLCTGILRPHAADDLLTMLAGTSYSTEARCPRFLQFLKEVFEPHPDVIDFVLRALGYSLCGDVTEQCLFEAYGTGANGKSTLLELVRHVAGDYAGCADSAALLVRRYNSEPRDSVAGLRGKRLVTIQEADEGARLAEGLVKWLTGGDKITARRLYENLVEFTPSWKIWWAVNHRPTVRGTDLAIWRRIRLIPFDVSFEGRENRQLGTQLRAEGEGILRLLVKRHLRWREEGLKVSTSVREATQAYRTDSDQVGRFLQECARVEPQAQGTARDVYLAYSDWCKDNGEERLSHRALGLRLTERGIKRRRVRDNNGKPVVKYIGVKLRG